MQRQHQHVLLVRHPQQRRPHQWPVAQVEGRLSVLENERLDPRVTFVGSQAFNLQFNGPGGQHHLQGLPVSLGEYRAQGLVTRQQGLQAALQRRHIEPALKPQGHGNVVRRTLRRPLPEEPLTLLSIGQAQRLISRPLEHRRDLEQVDALLPKQSGQPLSLHRRELPYRLD